MVEQEPNPSARRIELLEASYRYALEHGLTDLSLRPLAAAIGSSPRVLMFLFGNKDGLVRALLARARTDEVAALDRLRLEPGRGAIGLAAAMGEVWSWLRAPEHRPLLRLWTEAYARSLVEPDGAWAGFATATVNDWLDVLASCQPPEERHSVGGASRRTFALALLRGCMLDLLATADEDRVDASLRQHLVYLASIGDGPPAPTST